MGLRLLPGDRWASQAAAARPGALAAPVPMASENTAVYGRLLRYLRPYLWPRFAGAAVCMLIFSATNGLMPLLVQHVFDDVFQHHDRAMLAWLPLVVLGTFAVRSFAGYGNTYLNDWVGQRIVSDLRDDLNSRIQRLPLAFFNRTATATIVSRMSNDVAQLRGALTQASVSLLRDTTSLLTLIGVAFWLDWVLALIAFVAFPLAVLPVLQFSKKLRRYSKRGQETLGLLSALMQETVQGNRIVKAFGMEHWEEKRFRGENQRLFRLYMKATQARAVVQPAMEMLAAFGIAGVIWYGGSSVIEGARTQGAFLGFFTALLLVYEPFKGLARTNTQVQQGLASAERIFELLDEPLGIEDMPGARELAGFTDAIRFEGVGFRYPARRPAAGEAEHSASGDEAAAGTWALRGIDLELRAGEVVALVGASGSGKSTLADLVPRFHDPGEGRITLDGVDLRGATLESLRARIGIVTQFTFLFNDTIRANIAYGSEEPRAEEIERAAAAAHVLEFVRELPEGFDTVVGELGVTLSGGQRQRIAIARALLKNAPILILDEATSALDSDSERLVQDAIDQLMAGRTTLVIAHRLATVRRAHRIAVLDAGRIVELGTHDELLRRAGAYRRLWEQQALAGPALEAAPQSAGGTETAREVGT